MVYFDSQSILSITKKILYIIKESFIMLEKIKEIICEQLIVDEE